MLNVQTILCPTDLSEPSYGAFRLACALARDYGAKIIVLHVYPTPANRAEADDRANDSQFEDELVETIRSNMPEHLGAVVEYQVVEGKPADEIVFTARDCDLVVMGTHGTGGLRRVLMGSVAEHVLRNAPCPVLTVRPEANVPTETVTATATSKNDGVDLGVGD
jgi:nucleotide-binding universal stress UspA family protein